MGNSSLRREPQDKREDTAAVSPRPTDAKQAQSQQEGAKLSYYESPRLPHYEGPPICVAVLGTGFRAMSLVRQLGIFGGESIKFVLYDEVPAALHEAKASLAVWVKHSIETVDTIEAAVGRPDVQWVMVTSKNCLHKEYSVAALEAGKHVFCEKPLATSIDDCLAIKESVAKAGKQFMTGFTLRYSPFYRRIRSLIEEGYLGRIVTMEANEMLTPGHGGFIFRNWRRFKDQSGPHVMEKCAHDIDILNWMAGSIVTKVAAFGGTDIFTTENKEIADKLKEESGPYAETLYSGWPTHEPDVDPFTSEKSVEDNIVVVLQYRNGTRATFQTNCCSALPQRQLKIFGLEGTLDGDSISGKLVAKRVAKGGDEIREERKGGQHAGGDEFQVEEMWSAFVHTAIQTVDSDSSEAETDTFRFSSSLEDCFISTITCLAIDEARETGEVVDLEKYWKKLGV